MWLERCRQAGPELPLLLPQRASHSGVLCSALNLSTLQLASAALLKDQPLLIGPELS
jgi:hypothetical protein